jgi:hypothetical protein
MACIRPFVEETMEFGNTTSFWVEYPSGLVDLSRPRRTSKESQGFDVPPPLDAKSQLEIPVDQSRTIRIDKSSSAIVIIDMQKYVSPVYIPYCYSTLTRLFYSFFLHRDLIDHPNGLKCVDPLLKVVPALRSGGVKILWVYVFFDPSVRALQLWTLCSTVTGV